MQRTISLAEPVTALRHVPIRECGEPLVDFHALYPRLLMDKPRFHYRRETLIRESVAAMLSRADASLPGGYRLAIVEGWRAPLIQRRMYLAVWDTFAKRHPEWSVVRLRRTVNRFTAPIHSRVPPPHTTGGAVDVSLVDDAGKPYEMCSPYAARDPRAFISDVQGLSEEAARNRAILRESMAGTGLTNYPSEYWHWSYGDQGWAYRGGHPAAIFGAIEPEGWSPDPADMADGPLIFVSDVPSD